MREWRTDVLWMISIAIAAIAVLSIMSAEPDPCETYREMRQIWDESQGSYGWPEFERGKDEECGYES